MYNQAIFPSAEPVTTSDSQNLPRPGILYIGVTGNLVLGLANGQTVTLVGVTAGTILPVKVVKVFATGTTAQNIVLLSGS